MAREDIFAGLDRLIEQAAPSDRPGLIVALAARLARLGAGLAVPVAVASPGRHDTEDGNVSVREAAHRLGISTSYIYKNANALPFTVRIGRRLVCSTLGVERWSRQRETAGKRIS